MVVIVREKNEAGRGIGPWGQCCQFYKGEQKRPSYKVDI